MTSGLVLTALSPTPVGSGTCDSGANERFPLSGVEWRAMGNMCVTANGTTSGATLSVQPCNGSNTQKWRFLDGDSATTLRFDQIKLAVANTNLCVETATTSGALGQALTLHTCSSSDTKQRFTYPGRGIIGFGNWCMNVSGGLPNPGSQLALWDGCNADPGLYNEVFTLAGNIKTAPLPNGQGQNVSQCLDASNASQVTVSTCQPAGTNPKSRTIRSGNTICKYVHRRGSAKFEADPRRAARPDGDRSSNVRRVPHAPRPNACTTARSLAPTAEKY